MRELNRNAIGNRNEQVIAHLAAETRVGDPESIDVDAKNSMAVGQSGFCTAQLSLQSVEKLASVEHLSGFGAPGFELQAKRPSRYTGG